MGAKNNGALLTRIDSIDALRGAVMIVMALDHIRDFLHSAALAFQPNDLTRTTAAIFFTRWITHFCAPVFMFTAGVSAFLVLNRNGDKDSLARFLRRRGVWLIVLELIVVRLAFAFSLTQGLLVLSVLWALGWSMIVLSALIYLPVRLLAALSVAVIACHNLLDPVRAASFGAAGWMWNLLHQPGVFAAVLVAYPLIPWFAVMSAGFCFGRVWTMPTDPRQRIVLRLGLGLTLAFVVIRFANIYGNPSRWEALATPLFTFLSFLNVAKYPPSLDFLLMTLGPALLVLWAFDSINFSRSNPLLVFGRVPLFYFLLHLFLIHAIAVVLAFARYGDGWFALQPLPSMGAPPESYPANYGYELWVVYLIWLLLTLAMYPLCLWFDRLKSSRRFDWTRYL